MTLKTPEQIAEEVLPKGALAGIGYEHDYEVAVRAIEADRAQRDTFAGAVYVIQSENGDVIDVTTNKEWADHLVTEGSARTIHRDTLWEGPENKED